MTPGLATVTVLAQSPSPAATASGDGSWRDLLEVRIEEPFSLSVEVGAVLGLLLLLLAAGFVLRWARARGTSAWRTESVRVTFAPGLSAELKRTDEVLRIAHAAWTEIVTRKAALKFDPEHDLIVEIYDSWYALFKELRALTRSVPAERLSPGSDARELVNLLVRVLNEGLRPHLTRYQARFRRYYDYHTTEYTEDADGQAIQRRFPQYDEMVDEMSQVNDRMVEPYLTYS